MARGVKRLKTANTGLLEGLVFSYWQATSENRDWGMRQLAFDKIRREVQKALKNSGVVWDARTDRLLMDCCLNYSSARMVPFLVYFCRRVRETYYLTEGQEQKLSEVAREAGKNYLDIQKNMHNDGTDEEYTEYYDYYV